MEQIGQTLEKIEGTLEKSLGGGLDQKPGSLDGAPGQGFGGRDVDSVVINFGDRSGSPSVGQMFRCG
jgi:hypothetical protein